MPEDPNIDQPTTSTDTTTDTGDTTGFSEPSTLQSPDSSGIGEDTTSTSTAPKLMPDTDPPPTGGGGSGGGA